MVLKIWYVHHTTLKTPTPMCRKIPAALLAIVRNMQKTWNGMFSDSLGLMKEK
jgi:hypothetical protein